jgi:hypothetical protein
MLRKLKWRLPGEPLAARYNWRHTALQENKKEGNRCHISKIFSVLAYENEDSVPPVRWQPSTKLHTVGSQKTTLTLTLTLTSQTRKRQTSVVCITLRQGLYLVGLRPDQSRSQETRGLRRGFACWVCGFESRLRNGCLSLVSVVGCQEKVSVRLITNSEESYRVWCLWVLSWSLKNEALVHWGCPAI